MEATVLQKRWILYGAYAAILSAIIYPVIYYLDISDRIDILTGLLFAFSIGISSIGIFHFGKIHRDGLCLQIGGTLGVIAALIFVLNIVVWHSLKAPLEEVLVKGDQSFVYSLTARIHYGFNFSWEILIAGSILSFGIAFFMQPKPGKVIALLGIVVALVILIFGFYAFPEKPETKNLVGIGPLLPFWHLVVAIFMISSLKWIKDK
ncbi:MAG: hypothetical protein ACP5E3_06070 [Bacteroidales bacterium]